MTHGEEADMDCHRCRNITYAGCRYGRCSHPGHRDVFFSSEKGRKRKYNKQICPDFVMKRRCSNCKYWKRGRYFADGMTPAEKGSCSLRISRAAEECPMWGAGPTSSSKRKEKKNEEVKNH